MFNKRHRQQQQQQQQSPSHYHHQQNQQLVSPSSSSSSLSTIVQQQQQQQQYLPHLLDHFNHHHNYHSDTIHLSPSSPDLYYNSCNNKYSTNNRRLHNNAFAEDESNFIQSNIRRSISAFLQSMGQQISRNTNNNGNNSSGGADHSQQPGGVPLSYHRNREATSSKLKAQFSVSDRQQQHSQQQYAASESTSIRQNFSLTPTTSPPEDKDNQYPSAFCLSPITSNESYNYYSDDASMTDAYPELGHHHHHHDISYHHHLRSQSQQQLLGDSIGPELTDVSPASSYGEEEVADVEATDTICKEGSSSIDEPRHKPKETAPLVTTARPLQPYTQEQEEFSPLLSLPMEILIRVLEYVYVDTDISSINSNLENFANTVPLLSKKFHQLSLCFLYKYTIFNRPHSFEKFLHNLQANPIIGKFVEFMDFQQFTSIGLGRTGRMNQEIQMVTSRTIAHALSMTPNLMEFLASENIQDDMDVSVLNILFNKLPKLKALDFCGASSEAFARAFDQLTIKVEDLPITKLSFHDCSNISQDALIKILKKATHLTRLDLSHTAITSSILLNLPQNIRLTHLSLARCSKLTTKDLIHFLSTHQAISHGSLQWLNLQIDSNVVSPLSDVYLLYTLKHLNAPNLQYLNIGGMPVNSRILYTIKTKFPQLVSLNISHALNVTLDELNGFMQDNTTLRYLDLTGIKSLNKNVVTFLKQNFQSNLEAIEFDYKSLYDYTSRGDCFRVQQPPPQLSQLHLLLQIFTSLSFIEDTVYSPPQVWKFYDNEGRRAWIYKMSEEEYKRVTTQSNLVYYDLETGQKIVTKMKKPQFLKYAGRKVNCSIGYYNLNGYKDKKFVEGCWPVEFSQRGIYNYYSLNVK